MASQNTRLTWLLSLSKPRLRAPMILVLCTCPNPEVADALGETLVEERLAACVNRIAGMVSTYRWKESIHTMRSACC